MCEFREMMNDELEYFFLFSLATMQQKFDFYEGLHYPSSVHMVCSQEMLCHEDVLTTYDPVESSLNVWKITSWGGQKSLKQSVINLNKVVTAQSLL